MSIIACVIGILFALGIASWTIDQMLKQYISEHFGWIMFWDLIALIVMAFLYITLIKM